MILNPNMGDENRTIEVLRKAAEIVDAGWCQGYMSRPRNAAAEAAAAVGGVIAMPLDKDYHPDRLYCASGAIEAASSCAAERGAAERVLAAYIVSEERTHPSRYECYDDSTFVQKWNDGAYQKAEWVATYLREAADEVSNDN